MVENNLEGKLKEKSKSPKLQKIAYYLIGGMTIAGLGTGVAGADSVMDYLAGINEIPNYAEVVTKTLSGIATSYSGNLIARHVSKIEGFRESLYNIRN